MQPRFAAVVLFVFACGGSSGGPVDASTTPDGAPDAAIPVTLSVGARHQWAFGGGGQPIGGGAGRDAIAGLQFAAATSRSWFVWGADGHVVTFGDATIQAASVGRAGINTTALYYVESNGAVQAISLFFPVPLSENVTFDLDTVHSIGGNHNSLIAIGQKAGTPRFADDFSSVAVAGLTSVRYDASVDVANAVLLSPQRADAGNALLVRPEGTLMYAATTSGAAAVNISRLVMDGILYSLTQDGARTQLATLTTDEVGSVGFLPDGTIVLQADNSIRRFSRDGQLLATESGIGRVIPERDDTTVTPGTSIVVLDDRAMRFDPVIASVGNAGEMRVTGHPDGNVALVAGASVVSAAGDTLIVQDPATGKWTDDSDTAFGVSAVASQGDKLAIGGRLIGSSVRIARVIGGRLAFADEYELVGATSAPQVAWSASGERLAIAYRTDTALRVDVRHRGADPELEASFDVPASGSAGAPLVAWDLVDERLAIAYPAELALWTPGQPAPTLKVSAPTATKLAWGPGHRLAIGDATGVTLRGVDLAPLGGNIAVAGDFAWSPSGRLVLVDVGKIRVWSNGAFSDAVELALPPAASSFPPTPLRVTRVGWIDDSHIVAASDRGIVARFELAISQR